MSSVRWSEATDYDGAWQEALEMYLQPFVNLCFPQAAAGIEWSVPVEFLDQELQQIVRDADLGRQRVDKLVKVRRRDGVEEWVLLHVEVQAQPDAELPLRLYQYHHRIADRFGRQVATLVVLADERTDWKPASYEEELWGCRVRFEYPVCKLRELGKARLQQEAEAKNPAAVVIAAHLAAQGARDDMEGRHQSKWQLTRQLYERGYDRQEILDLFRLIDWLMALPKELEVAFEERVFQYERQQAMTYITSIERSGIEKGRQEEGIRS